MADFSKKGVLYLVATPIGNLEDISYRAVRTLKEADLIAAEDTRHSKILLNHYNIETPLISYHEHNEHSQAKILVKKINEGKSIALITDAGTPAISDPGNVLVKECINQSISIVWIPGATAFVGALAVSGMDLSSFLFCGFLNSSKNKRKKELLEFLQEKRTLVFYEAPHRIKSFLEDLKTCLGDREICLVRELTKKFETVLRGKVEQVLEQMNGENLKGEFVVVVSGNREEQDFSDISFKDHLEQLMQETGLPKKDAIYLVAQIRGISKREVYKQVES